jgi:hypothetical protein
MRSSSFRRGHSRDGVGWRCRAMTMKSMAAIRSISAIVTMWVGSGRKRTAPLESGAGGLVNLVRQQT